MDPEPLIPKHGGYRKLISFQVAQLCYDITVRFVDRYIDKFSRTRDQMVQAACSGVQNIAEGSQASGTSKKTELKLTNVARASLEELALDYEDFLRPRKLPKWASDDPRRAALIARRCGSADAVSRWIRETSLGDTEEGNGASAENKAAFPALAANAALVLLKVACGLLDRQIASLATAFTDEGGFTERLTPFPRPFTTATAGAQMMSYNDFRPRFA
jgi:four helix bundle suffix protein